ncbi:MAG: RnfH family protein [Steroidobacteraceae bacterium]
MPEHAHKHCLLAIDAAAGPLLIELVLPLAATIADALRQARDALHAADGIDWDGGATGVWGQRRERSAVPRDGDRIELYRALSADPRAQRRARARTHATRG